MRLTALYIYIIQFHINPVSNLKSLQHNKTRMHKTLSRVIEKDPKHQAIIRARK